MKFETRYNLYRLLSNIYSKYTPPSCRRILMYHNVSSSGQEKYDHYTVDFLDYIKHLDFFQSHSLSISHFDNTEGDISITFDDGFLDNLKLVAPVMEERSIPWTIFIATDLIGRGKWYLNNSSIVELSKFKQVKIGAHGHSHTPLTSMSLEAATDELYRSKSILEGIIGQEVDTMSFPHGQFNNSILTAAYTQGYSAVCTSLPGGNKSHRNEYYYRDAIFEFDSLDDLYCKINGGWDWLRIWKEVV